MVATVLFVSFAGWLPTTKCHCADKALRKVQSAGKDSSTPLKQRPSKTKNSKSQTDSPCPFGQLRQLGASVFLEKPSVVTIESTFVPADQTLIHPKLYVQAFAGVTRHARAPPIV